MWENNWPSLIMMSPKYTILYWRVRTSIYVFVQEFSAGSNLSVLEILCPALNGLHLCKFILHYCLCINLRFKCSCYMIYFRCSFLFNNWTVYYWIFCILYSIILYCRLHIFFVYSVYVITTIGEEDYEPSSFLLKPRQ